MKTKKALLICLIVFAITTICNFGVKAQTGQIVHPIEQVDPNVSQFPIVKGS